MKQLIVNADDFGLSTGANQAIIKGWKDGCLTSASLMVAESASDEAVSLAKENPGLQVGLHLTLVQGRASAMHKGFPSLVDHLGEFSNDPVHAGMRYFFLHSLKKQLEAEIESQIVRFMETGLNLSHIDGHLNIHMHPTVFDILCDLMPKYGIASFRLSRERLKTDLSLAPRRYLGKAVDAFIFNRLAKRCRPKLEELGIKYTVEVKGLLNSGQMNEEYLLKSLDILQEGVSEIYFHPGYSDEELQSRMPGYMHEKELEALTSKKVMEKIRSIGITLCNYRGEHKDV